MALMQRMKIANEKAAKNITLRGNVPKTSVRNFFMHVQNVENETTDCLIISI